MELKDDEQERSSRLFMLRALTGKLTLLNGVPVALDVDVELDVIAGMTPGFGEAALRRLVNVALNGVRRRVFDELMRDDTSPEDGRLTTHLKVSQKDFVDAVDQVRLEKDLDMATREVLQDTFERRFGDLVWDAFRSSGKLNS